MKLTYTQDARRIVNDEILLQKDGPFTFSKFEND